MPLALFVLGEPSGPLLSASPDPVGLLVVVPTGVAVVGPVGPVVLP